MITSTSDAKDADLMTDAFLREVIHLHQFLQSWLRGGVRRGDGRPERLADALSDDFVVIQPNGTRKGKADVVRDFSSAYGEKSAAYALKIGQVETRMICEGVCPAPRLEPAYFNWDLRKWL